MATDEFSSTQLASLLRAVDECTTRTERASQHAASLYDSRQRDPFHQARLQLDAAKQLAARASEEARTARECIAALKGQVSEERERSRQAEKRRFKAEKDVEELKRHIALDLRNKTTHLVVKAKELGVLGFEYAESLEKIQKEVDDTEKRWNRQLNAIEAQLQAPHHLCVICLEMMRPGDKVVRLPCMCVFHEQCLMPRLRNGSVTRCPIDRSEVPHDTAYLLPISTWGQPSNFASSVPPSSPARVQRLPMPALPAPPVQRRAEDAFRSGPLAGYRLTQRGFLQKAGRQFFLYKDTPNRNRAVSIAVDCSLNMEVSMLHGWAVVNKDDWKLPNFGAFSTNLLARARMIEVGASNLQIVCVK